MIKYKKHKNRKWQATFNLLSHLSPFKNLCFAMLLLLLVGCTNQPENPEPFIKHVEGYWEITEVTFPNGEKKIYKYNDTVDYISLNDSLQGFRKKLKPGINDTYFTSEDAEALVLKIENDSLNMYYSTAYNSWKETILEATPNNLRVINENKVVYLYKRYTPINLDLTE